MSLSDSLIRASETGLIPPRSRLLLAVSGGADSLALLYAAHEARAGAGWTLSVGHVHHGWRGRDADRDLAFVRDHARRLEVPFFSRRRDAREEARARGLSPEAGARQVRYEALHEMKREAGAERVATAHHADDRVESYWLARERKGGRATLAGPRRARRDGIVRPLLDVSRAEILAFLDARGLAFRRDSSNGDLGLARNRVRRELAGRSRGESERTRILAELDALERERERLDEEVERLLAASSSLAPGSAAADAELLAGSSEEVRRRVLERLAAPFARPGRIPFTGREREEIVRRLAEGGDFRFEAGRRLAIERRGPLLTLRPRAYDRSQESS